MSCGHIRMQDDLPVEHVDFTKDGKCIGCGACCSNVIPLTPTEIKAIQRYVKQHNIRPCNHIPAMMRGPAIDWVCPFRDESQEKCLIYEVRPLVCRLYKCDQTVADIKQQCREHAKVFRKLKATDMWAYFFGRLQPGAAELKSKTVCNAMKLLAAEAKK